MTGSIHQEDITIINTFIPQHSNSFKIQEAKLTELKEKPGNLTIAHFQWQAQPDRR